LENALYRRFYEGTMAFRKKEKAVFPKGEVLSTKIKPQ
jgi:hypothetical protein